MPLPAHRHTCRPSSCRGGTVDARSDVFSFGTVLYEMATGHRAFRRQSVSATAAAIVHDEPAAPRQLTPALPDDLERIILRCLKKDPARRFQHASDLKVELEELRDETQAKGTSNAPRARRRHLVLGAIVLAVVGIAATVTLWALRPAAFPEPTLVHLTSERSTEGGSFSPDGTQVAYASAGDDGINWDIRLKVVGEVESRRLTTDPAAEGYPSWSRDGTQIAFLRYNSGTTRGLTHLAVGTVHLISPVGGPDRQVSTFPARLQLSWSPDGRWLAVSKGRSPSGPPGGIYLLSIASGEARAITFPTAPAFDVSPAFSPEGHDLAYASCEGAEVTPACEVRVVALDTGYRPRGPTRALPSTRRGWIGVAWTRDGRSIVYGAGDLSRIRANGTTPPEPLRLMANAWWPSTALGRPRLAFMQRVGDADLYHLEEGRPPEPIVRSNVNDIQPQYSPDGRRIALVSAGAGETKREIWLADADGSNLVRLTRGPGLSQGWPGWSPDGRSIVFDSRDPNGHVDIWLIDASGSGLRQLTNHSGDEVLPSFSRDGRFVYFTSKRTGRDEVWRVPSAGGTQEQVSRDGGVFPFESWDGRTVYYLRAVGDAPLVGRSVEGGEEHVVLPCVQQYGYAVGPRGIFYTACGGEDAGASPRRHLRYWDAVTKRQRSVADVEAEVVMGLSVSPDGKHLLYGRLEARSDLMMIENFP